MTQSMPLPSCTRIRRFIHVVAARSQACPSRNAPKWSLECLKWFQQRLLPPCCLPCCHAATPCWPPAASLPPAIRRYRHRLPPEWRSLPHADRHARINTARCPARDRAGHDSRHSVPCSSHSHSRRHSQWRCSSRCASRCIRGWRQCYWGVCWQLTAAGYTAGASGATGSQADVCVDCWHHDDYVQQCSCQAAAQHAVGAGADCTSHTAAAVPIKGEFWVRATIQEKRACASSWCIQWTLCHVLAGCFGIWCKCLLKSPCCRMCMAGERSGHMSGITC